MSEAPQVAIVVLNWNGLAMTLECLESLRLQTWREREIVILDNGSTGDEADRIAGVLVAGERLVRSASNLGFAGGVNHVIADLLEGGRFRYFALLNNDAIAEPEWLAGLVATAQGDPKIGAVASKMVFHADPERIENAGVHLLSCGDNLPRGRGHLAAQWNTGADLLAFCGGAVILRSAMLAEIGLFRADFFANFEDVDLSLRAVVAGWRIRYAPGAVVRHHLNASIAKVRDAAFNVRSIRNTTWAYFVNMPLGVILANLAGLLCVNVALVLMLSVSGRGALAKAVIAGRWRAWGERSAILAERRRLAPLRRVGAFRIWWAQRAWWREAMSRLTRHG